MVLGPAAQVRESANLMRGLELANGMLLAVKGELGEVQEVRVALEEALEEKDRLNEALAGRVQVGQRAGMHLGSPGRAGHTVPGQHVTWCCHMGTLLLCMVTAQGARAWPCTRYPANLPLPMPGHSSPLPAALASLPLPLPPPLQELEAKVAELTKGGTVSEDAVAALQQQLGSKSDTLKAALAELETANGHLEVMSKSSGIKDDTIAHLTRWGVGHGRAGRSG